MDFWNLITYSDTQIHSCAINPFILLIITWLVSEKNNQWVIVTDWNLFQLVANAKETKSEDTNQVISHTIKIHLLQMNVFVY